jgi:hypothetical protein
VTDRACMLCDFAGDHPDDDNKRLCRRMSPIEMDGAGNARWPVTKPMDWCGDFLELRDDA